LSNYHLADASSLHQMIRDSYDNLSHYLVPGWSSMLPTRLLMLLVLVMFLTSCQFINTDTARLTSQASGGQDWPMFLHDPERTAVSSETILSPSNVGHLKKLWAFKTGAPIAASAAVVGGVVYVGSWDGYEYALDATTGRMKWKTFLGITNVPGCYPPVAGITSGAAVQNGVVYVGGGDDYWYALDAKTGKILWKVYTGDNSPSGGHYNWSSPLLYHGYAYIGIASFGDCPLVQGQLLKVSLKTHQVAQALNFVPDGQVGGGLWSSPVLDPATNTIFAATGTGSFQQPLTQALLAIDASTLQVKDEYKVPEGQTLPDSSDFGATPRLFQDAAGHPLLADINKDGYLYAFNRYHLAAGPIWRTYIAYSGGGFSSVSTGAFGGGRLYQAGGNSLIDNQGFPGTVRALDPATGRPLWERGITGIGAGFVVGPMAYMNEMVMYGAGSVFEVLNAATGAVLFSYETGNDIYAAPSISHGQIFIGSTDGNLYSFGLR